MSARTSTTTLTTPEPGILSKSGLDITLENIDTQLVAINKKLDNAPTKEQVQNLKDEVTEIKTELEGLKDKYANKSSFELVQKIVFGAVGLILIGVLGGLLSLILK